MEQIPFTKMHGLGNDFIVISNLNKKYKLSPKQVAFMCERHKGIGADGLILVESSSNADCFMNYYNADGTTAEMCGNGIRCTASFFLQNKQSLKKVTIDTRAGIKKVDHHSDNTFSVLMGKPVFEHENFPSGRLAMHGLSFECVSIGNPHTVTFMDNLLSEEDVKILGPKIEHDSLFSHGINVEIVKKISSDHFKVIVWERGSGVTLACGTGACAVYAIARKNKMANSAVTVELPGGKLSISENKIGEIIMRGPAERVFDGLVSI